MKSSTLINTIFKNTWCILPAYADSWKEALEKLSFADLAKEESGILAFDAGTPQQEISNRFSGINPGSIVVVNINDVMLKNSDLCTIGTEEIAAVIQDAFDSKNVDAVILKIDSPGGTLPSVIPLQNVLQNKPKPVFALVDSQADSAAYWAAVLADKIFAVSDLAEVGSIGVMQVFRDTSEKDKQAGIKTNYIIHPKSFNKNKEMLDAMNGDFTLAIASMDVPVEKFHETVLANRKNLTDKEKTLSGAVFYAQEALSNGMIDGIATLDEVVAKIKDEVLLRKINNNF